MGGGGGFSQSTLGEEGSMIPSATCEGSAAGHASIDVELYWVPVTLVNDECAISGGKERSNQARSLQNSGGE